MTRDEADKGYADANKKGRPENITPVEYRLRKIIADSEKELIRNEPITNAEVIAEMNKKRIAGIEKRKITLEIKKQKS